MIWSLFRLVSLFDFFNFLMVPTRVQKSGLSTVLCFQSGNLNTKKKNISQFLISALAYGLPERYLFKPDDVVVMAHFHK